MRCAPFAARLQSQSTDLVSSQQQQGARFPSAIIAKKLMLLLLGRRGGEFLRELIGEIQSDATIGDDDHGLEAAHASTHGSGPDTSVETDFYEFVSSDDELIGQSELKEGRWEVRAGRG